MSTVFSALAVSVDGYITGREPAPGRGLGDGGRLFDWYGGGDVASEVFDGFTLSAPSARVFDALAARVGATVVGRTTYEHSERFGEIGAPHPSAPLFVLSHHDAPQMGGRQHLVTTGIADAITAARAAAGDKDVALMGGEVVTAALAAGLVDELVLHQVPVLLGAGRPYFGQLPAHVELSVIEVVPDAGVTHLRYQVLR